MRIVAQALAAVAVVGAVAVGGSAYTNANTVPTVAVGQGAQDTSGYVVSQVAYALSDGASGAPANITGLTFELAPVASGLAPKVVKVRLLKSSAYATCGTIGTVNGTGAYPVTCAGLSVPASAADTLDIVASSV